MSKTYLGWSSLYDPRVPARERMSSREEGKKRWSDTWGQGESSSGPRSRTGESGTTMRTHISRSTAGHQVEKTEGQAESSRYQNKPGYSFHPPAPAQPPDHAPF